jgi:uncharacterized metal-binding protein
MRVFLIKGVAVHSIALAVVKQKGIQIDTSIVAWSFSLKSPKQKDIQFDGPDQGAVFRVS